MDSFDEPIWSVILLHLPLRQVLKYSTINKRVCASCRYEIFWKTYLQVNFKINISTNVKRKSLLLNHVLDQMKKKQLFISCKSMEYLLNNVTDDDLLYFISDIDNQQIISAFICEDVHPDALQHHWNYKIPEFRLKNLGEYNAIDIHHKVLTSKSIHNIKTYQSLVGVGTFYLTINGIIRLDFDCDFSNFLSYSTNDHMTPILFDLLTYFETLGRIKQQEMLVKYLL